MVRARADLTTALTLSFHNRTTTVPHRPLSGLTPRLFRTVSAFALVVLTLAACEGDPTGVNTPVALITTPVNGTVYAEGEEIVLVGTATDFEEGPLPDSRLSWSSSIDGDLGSGGEVTVTNASLGMHTITLTAIDAAGGVGTATVTISVEALEFHEGTTDNAEIGIIVNSLGNSLRLFQLGDVSETRDIELGASSTVTATGISVRGDLGVVPLGNAASVAVIDLTTQEIGSYFVFASGNATGSTFVDEDVVLVANQTTDELGRFAISQSSTDITETVAVTQFPTDVIAVSDSLALVVSGNLDDSYAAAGDGVVTAIDPRTMTVIAVIDPSTMTRLKVVGGFPAGSGDIHVDASGLVYVSAFFAGTVVWNSTTETFVRDGSDPVCAPIAGGGCRGAFSTHTGADGSLYQTFFGSASQGLDPQLFVYEAETFALTDSIATGQGPVGIEVATFR
jgi:hypothetical protein